MLRIDTIKLIAFLLLINRYSFAQPELETGVALTYDMNLSEVEEGSVLGYDYQPGKAALFTPFYVPELNKFSDAFLTHINEMRSVKNYVGVLGYPEPTTLGEYLPNEALRMVADGTFERIGGFYLRTDEYSVLQSKDDGIYMDDELYIKDGKVNSGKDTVYTEDLVSGEMIMKVVDNTFAINKEATVGGFIEEWSFKANKGKFEKDIKYLRLMTPAYDNLTNDFRGFKGLMQFKAGKFRNRNYNEEGLIKKGIEYHVLFNRHHDTDEQLGGDLAHASHTNGYLEPNERFTFLLKILSAVKDGQVSIYEYDALTFDTDKLEKAENKLYFEKLVEKETVFGEDVVTGEMISIVMENKFRLDEVVGINFFEDWYIDADKMGMYKRVNGIVLLREKKDEITGEAIGLVPYSPYYIKLNP